MSFAAPDHRSATPGKPPAALCQPVVTLAARTLPDINTPEFITRWDALADWACEPNPFFESWYLLPSLADLDERGEVRVLCLEVDGSLAGIMPIAPERSYYGYPFPHRRNWVHPNCFLGAPLVARSMERIFWRALFDWADAEAGHALFLHLAHLPLHGPMYTALKAELAEDGRAHALVMQEERAFLNSRLSPEAYLEAAITGKKRKELRRQHRRLAEMGNLTVTRTQAGEGLDEWIARFLALEAAGWKGEAGSALASSPRTERLFALALQGAAQRGKLQRLSLNLDGRPIAMLANFLTAPGSYSYKTAFDESFSRFSPGVLLQRENLALLDSREIEWCDSCASADHPMIDHFWRERRPVGRINIALGGKARRTLFSLISRAELRGKKGLLP